VELMQSKSLEELYQHFRLSVAGWLNSELPSEFLKNMESNIIFNKGLPAFEKRKRLQIELEDILKDWFVQDDDFVLEEDVFYRRDCRKITDAGSCSGACSWSESSGRCGIHIPTSTTLSGPILVNTADLFIRRVIDELIIFPDKRRQLLLNTVKKTGNITTAIQIGDQYIIPDSSPRWQELLSLIWAIDKSEAYQSLEESKGTVATEEEEDAEPCVQFERSVPYTIQKIRRRPTRVAAAEEEVAPIQKAVPIPPLTESRPLTIRRMPTAAAAMSAAVPTIRRVPTSAAPTISMAPVSTLSMPQEILPAAPTIRRVPVPALSVPQEILPASGAPTIRRAVPAAPSPLAAAAEGNTVSITAAPTIRRGVLFANGGRPGQTPTPK
jgi:hypothetical protein